MEIAILHYFPESSSLIFAYITGRVYPSGVIRDKWSIVIVTRFCFPSTTNSMPMGHYLLKIEDKGGSEKKQQVQYISSRSWYCFVCILEKMRKILICESFLRVLLTGNIHTFKISILKPNHVEKYQCVYFLSVKIITQNLLLI